MGKKWTECLQYKSDHLSLDHENPHKKSDSVTQVSVIPAPPTGTWEAETGESLEWAS